MSGGWQVEFLRSRGLVSGHIEFRPLTCRHKYVCSIGHAVRCTLRSTELLPASPLASLLAIRFSRSRAGSRQSETGRGHSRRLLALLCIRCSTHQRLLPARTAPLLFDLGVWCNYSKIVVWEYDTQRLYYWNRTQRGQCRWYQHRLYCTNCMMEATCTSFYFMFILLITKYFFFRNNYYNCPWSSTLLTNSNNATNAANQSMNQSMHYQSTQSIRIQYHLR
mmetsp:Transcript_5110/g.14332  ORF Transcript_5110/g.14332 Transcript_5110/m.14332 type:complete len:221 (-) Transcript_5110:26-688(-)